MKHVFPISDKYLVRLTCSQTKVINATRCLLVILVVFIHVLPNRNPTLDTSDVSSCLYSVITEMISHNIAKIAVPCFFVFSGFFFFYTFDGVMSGKWLAGKLKKRIKTLLLPYLFWNIVFVGLIILKNNAVLHTGAGDDFYNQLRELGWYGVMWGWPINLPLWYIRDLLCLSIISPIFYYLFKYLKGYGLLLLAMPYYLLVDTGIPGFGTVSLFFFGVGAYLSVNRINMISVANNFEAFGYSAAILFLISSVLLSGNAAHEIVIRFFIPFGIVSLINLVCRMGERTVSLLSSFAACSFFVYAAHWIYIRNWSNGLAVHLFGSGMSGRWLSYFFSPLFTILVCAAVFFVMKRFMPGTLRLINGGRI